MDIKDLKRRYKIIGTDPKLNDALSRAVRVAPVDMSVLVIGENGVGKEIIPQIIHDNSGRAKKPYFAINCGALPEGTINSELFGHVKGAFTDAIADHKGYFETADGGTLFLDEVAELPIETQARLLRVLETGEFFKMGSAKVLKTNVRIVAATNKDLQREIAAGRFREDLYYRLAQVQITVPPLRERGDDILLLFDRFKIDFAALHRLSGEVTLLPDACERLKQYSWPGNVRQLKNLTEQIALFEAGNELDEKAIRVYLPSNELIPVGKAEFNYERDREVIFSLISKLSNDIAQIRQLLNLVPESAIAEHSNEIATEAFQTPILPSMSAVPYSSKEALIRKPYNLEPVDSLEKTNHNDEAEMVESFDINETPHDPTLKDMERRKIREELVHHNGNRKRTAIALGISERTLYRKIKEFQLN